MTRFVLTLLVGLVVSLGTSDEVFASDLSVCPSYNAAYFNNCFGTKTWTNVGKYVGEWQDNDPNGQGTIPL